MAPDEIRQVVRDLVTEAISRSCGKTPEHLSSLLQRLATPIVSWRQILRQFLGKHVGNRRLTYSRRNRRNDAFGIPGFTRHTAGNVLVLVDTSGSIEESELQQFFAEIESDILVLIGAIVVAVISLPIT